MSDRAFSVDADVRVEITVHDPAVIERVTGPGGDEWRLQFYDLYTVDDVIRHLASNAIVNGIDDVSRLEGWGDLAPTAASIVVGRDIVFDVRAG